MRLLLVVAGCVALLITVVLVACSRPGSPPGTGETGASSPGAKTGRRLEFRVEARLEQLSERNPDLETSRLTVVFRDPKGKEVETPDLRLELNGAPLTYTVGRGNYYDRHPSYRLREDDGFRFEADTTYELTARRGDEAAQPLARLRTPKPMGRECFRLPASQPGDADLEVAWTRLLQPADLLVSRTLETIDEAGNHVTIEGGPYGDDVIRRRVGARGLKLPDGSTTIPASYFAAKEGRVTSVRLEFTAAGEGQFLCPVLEPSTLTVVRRVVLPVEVTAPRSR